MYVVGSVFNKLKSGSTTEEIPKRILQVARVLCQMNPMRCHKPYPLTWSNSLPVGKGLLIIKDS